LVRSAVTGPSLAGGAPTTLLKFVVSLD
jgi:hypothetical protein